jgi:hypothetical protein
MGNPGIRSITPASTEKCGRWWDMASFTITGTGFDPTCSVNLTRAGEEPITAFGVDVQSPTTIECVTYLREFVSMKHGGVGEAWNVVVTNTDGKTGTLPDAYTLHPGSEIFNNWNNEEVSNSPESSPQFEIGGDFFIKFIETYHWNDGRGSPPGTIALKDADGTIYGPWKARGLAQGTAQNVYWFVNPDRKIEAGTYTIIDSDTQTWSHNAGSDNAGFAIVRACDCLFCSQ